MEAVTLTGTQVRLEPLLERHASALAHAASQDRSLYEWSAVPDGAVAMAAYVRTALEWQRQGRALPFAIVRRADDCIVGSTRFFDLERWPWPPQHERHVRDAPDAGEIGYTWLAADAIRTSLNTEAKFLLLRHAFEVESMFRICFHTDARNERSSRALERIGAGFEGVLRAHRLATDLRPRDSKRFAIVASDWPDVKRKLEAKLAR